MSKVLGIDLGTGNSAMCIYENGAVKMINNSEGNPTTPSVIAFNNDGTTTVGQIAKRQAVMNPKTVIHSVKRLIGKKYSQVQDLKKVLAYDIVENKNGMAAVKIGEKVYSPEEISAKVLMKLKTDAEAYLGEKIKDAVITVPAYFGDAERNATRDAGRIAGLNVLRIINEPTAAALAYGMDKSDSKIIAVGDIGCGTSDATILEYGNGVFEVLATAGDPLLGGDDIDEAMMKFLADDFKKQYGIDLLADNTSKARLKEACEKAKCELSNATMSTISLPFISANASGPLHLTFDFTRAQLEKIVSEVFDKFETQVRQCIKDSGKDVSEISDIIMVGGTTRIPYVQEFFKRIFGKDVNKSVNPDEAVAQGAAIQGAVLGGDKTVGDILLLDVTSLSFGLETLGGVFTRLIDRGTTIPVKKTETFTTASDNQGAVTLKIYQGERDVAAQNKLIGNFDLDGIPPAPRGVPKIEVSFDVDASGILTVSAKDLGTGKESHITITQNSGLSEEEIQRMVKDAEINREADKKFKEDQETLNKADSIVFNLEKQMKDLSGKLPADLESQLNEKISTVKSQKDAKDIEGLKKSTEELQQLAMKMGEEIYKNAQSAGAGNSNGNGNSYGYDYDENESKSAKTNPDGSVDAEVV